MYAYSEFCVCPLLSVLLCVDSSLDELARSLRPFSGERAAHSVG